MSDDAPPVGLPVIVLKHDLVLVTKGHSIFIMAEAAVPPANEVVFMPTKAQLVERVESAFRRTAASYDLARVLSVACKDAALDSEYLEELIKHATGNAVQSVLLLLKEGA